MKVFCYEEGYGDDSQEYAKTPEEAARVFCEEEKPDREAVNVIVVPADEEAIALGGWHSDEDEPHFRMFKATARVEVEWTARETNSFNPYYKGP